MIASFKLETNRRVSASILPKTPRDRWPPGSVFRAVPKQSCRLMEMWGICFNRTRRRLSNPTPPTPRWTRQCAQTGNILLFQKNGKIRNTRVSRWGNTCKNLVWWGHSILFRAFFFPCHHWSHVRPSAVNPMKGIIVIYWLSYKIASRRGVDNSKGSTESLSHWLCGRRQTRQLPPHLPTVYSAGFTTVTKGASGAWPWGPRVHSDSCERETGAPTSGPLWQHKIDEASLVKRLTGEK